MKRPFDKRTQRLLRLLDFPSGRPLHEEHQLNPELREDLALEAAFGAEYFNNALMTPELLVDLRALLRKLRRPPVQPANSKGTVIIVPGGLATELADKGKVRPSKIWLYPPALLSGRFADLQLAKYKGPNNEKDLNAPDVKIKTLRAFPILYHPLCAELSHDGWRPVMFPYDWRKDMEGDEISARSKRRSRT